jgi:hypothetical protein
MQMAITTDASNIPVVSLDEASLMAEAMRETGLSDFGDTRFREGLQRLLDALNQEAKLNAFGRFYAHGELLRHLSNRLRVTEDWKRHPEMGAERIQAPIFVVSLPRSGSTILHLLLVQDPDARFPATWECNLPSPPTERATFGTDPRIAQWEDHIANTLGRFVPEFKAMHPMAARFPDECNVLNGYELTSQVFSYQFHVPSYEAWYERTDLSFVYATHRRQLQYMQWHYPGVRWVLKAVNHLWALDHIFNTYPDARIVQTHRDPLNVIASLTSLLSTGFRMVSDEVDSAAIAREWAESWARALRKAMDFRDSGRVDQARFFDVHYGEFMQDPIAMVARIYTHFGFDLSPEAERRMRSFLASNPQGKHGEHRYSLAQFGLNAEVERERYRFYTERYSVQPEAS